MPRNHWQVFSPDGLPIAPTTYPSLRAAVAARLEWCRHYVGAAYIDSRGLRIPVSVLPAYCRVELLKTRYQREQA